MENDTPAMEYFKVIMFLLPWGIAMYYYDKYDKTFNSLADVVQECVINPAVAEGVAERAKKAVSEKK